MLEWQIDERVKNILNRIHAGVLYCKNDNYSTILYANDYFYTIVGYTKEEVKRLFGNRFADMVVDDVSEILMDVAASIERGENLDFEFRMRRKDGQIIYIHDTACYDKEYNCFYITIMDVTAMKSIEYEREKFNSYLQHLPNKIIISDSEGNIVYKNSEAEKCTYFDANADRLIDLVKPYIIGIDFENLEETLKKGGRAQYETRFKKGTEFIGHDKNYIVPIKDKNNNILNYMQVSENLLSNSDYLTSFPTRAMFEYYYKQLLANRGLMSAFLCIVDIDNFKSINDRYGHLIGDEAIKLTAKRLTEFLGQEDYICRYGGDEFLLLLIGIEEEDVISRIHSLLETSKRTVCLGGYEFYLTYSIGVAATKGQRISYTELMKRADESLYEVKLKGKGRMIIYQEACTIK